ncbi:SPOR domain-containing protein [Sphingomonas sp.]|uniref:SPOR domain-containing protein n=1 Tax=Sphingomonas sp. TaxID=28214 RepID=UPI0025D13D69|nr:SPOR domain-containing protein [Sphingomonas sp.]
MLRRTLTFAALGFAVAGGAQAQTASENRDADALAADMRLLAANPLDIEALITAGELTLRMGDSTASAGFFGRAEKLDPLNPRIKAGWGSLMVRAERPGMALVRFQEAERRGLDPAKFAADRGLAYDLIGEQERAQRDYRLALRDGPDDEVTRRYALSLGISGKKDEALKLLEPLLRKGDRPAWRDRAFVLAMNGDTAGAEKIAETMMSPGLGAGLTPFFRRLPQLSAADRAFAVTFGEMRATPERVADAKLTPPLPKLGPDPYAPKVAAEPPRVVVAAADDGRKRKKRGKGEAVVPAGRQPLPAPVEVALAPPVYVAPRAPTPAPTPAPTVIAASKPTPAPVPPPVRVAAVQPRPTPPAPTPAPPPAPTPAPPPVAVVAPPPPSPAPTPVPAPSPTPAPAPAPTEVAAVPTPTTDAAPDNPTPTAPVMVAANPTPAPPAEPVPGTADQPSAAEAGVPQPTGTARVSEDTVLARIVANLDKPTPVPSRRVRPAAVVAPPPPPAEPKAKPVEEPKPAPSRTRGRPSKEELADAKVESAKSKAPPVDAKGRPIKAKDADDEPVLALDKNGCPIPPKPVKGRAAAPIKTKKPMTAREKANDARCKAATAKAKADAETKGEPARVWVQVAGGANEGDLKKAWAALQSKAPDLFRGRQGWTTPLRATNRVLTGPFKSDDEAQAFVNRMAKAGLSGFVFTSTKGQKVERLGAK